MPRKRGGRTRDEDDEDEVVDVINVESQDSPASKKHKKRKRKHGSDGSGGKKHGSGRHRSVKELSPAADESPAPEYLKPPIKLKIRIGNETFGGSRSDGNYSAPDHSSLHVASLNPSDNQDEDDEESVDVETDIQSAPIALADEEEGDAGEADDFEQYEDVGQQQEILEDEDSDDDDDDIRRAGGSRRSDDSTSEDEKQWLDALESGNLEDYERKKQEKDPSLLTARQRALLGGATEIELLELPSGYKTTEMTEEQQQRRKQRALKRRMQAHEKKEKAKKQTLDRLLKKQQESSKRTKKKGPKTVQKPYIRYMNTANGCSMSAPVGIELPIAALPPKPLPAPAAQCGMQGCKNLRKYSCSRTGVPLCSLECYKKNLVLGSHAMKMPARAATLT